MANIVTKEAESPIFSNNPVEYPHVVQVSLTGGRSFLTHAAQLWRWVDRTPTPEDPWPNGMAYPTLDPLLRFLISRCLAAGDPSPQPSLRELLDHCEQAIEERHADFYFGWPNEGDDNIAQIVQDLILDADVDSNRNRNNS